MSPKLYINGDLVAELTEEADIVHGRTPDGKPVYVNMEGIDAGMRMSRVVVRSEVFRGREGLGRSTEEGLRRIDISTQGFGATVLPGGRTLAIQLDNVPIRGRVRGEDGRPQQWSHPRWRR